MFILSGTIKKLTFKTSIAETMIHVILSGC